MKLPLVSRKNLIIILFMVFVLSSCQTFPGGEKLPEIQEEFSGDSIPDLSTLGVYRYYAICRAAWKQRDAWMDSGWDLQYFLDEETDTLGLFIWEDDILYISFRSSRALLNDSVDLSYNSRIGLKPLPFLPDTGIKIHDGFLDKYMSIRQILLNELAENMPKEIVLVGHSAGGALASIAFIDIKHIYPDIPLNAITFGMVRVFNAKGAKWYRPYRDNFIRIVNGRDPIPNIPPVLFGYRHIGRLVRIGSRPFWKIYSVDDHHPGYYNELADLLRIEGIDPSTLGY